MAVQPRRRIRTDGPPVGASPTRRRRMGLAECGRHEAGRAFVFWEKKYKTKKEGHQVCKASVRAEGSSWTGHV